MLIREFFQMICLACADYRRERLLSLCSVLGLAAVLTPLLVLYGVKFGIVTTMVGRMRSDPLMLELSPVSSGHFTPAFFASLKQDPAVSFVLPRTRSIAATMQLASSKPDGSRRTVVCSMEPTAAGDPLLARYGCEAPLLVPSGQAPAAQDEGKAAPAGRTQSSLMDRLEGYLLTEARAEPAGTGKEQPAKAGAQAKRQPQAPLPNAGAPKAEKRGAQRQKAQGTPAALPEIAPLSLPQERAREENKSSAAPDGAEAGREAPHGGLTLKKDKPAQDAEAKSPAPAMNGLTPAKKQDAEPSKETAPRRGGLAAESDATLRLSGVVLSEEAASKLGVKKGDTVIGRVERAYQGKVSYARVRLTVTGVLPLAAQQKAMAYIPLTLLEATEDFRDGRAVPALGTENGWTGEKRPEGERVYPGFRLYVKDLGDVLSTRRHLAEKGVDTYTHAEEIAQIESLEKALNAVFLAICAAAALGFFASTASSAMAGVKRKERTLGLLELMGFSTSSLMLFPLVQVELTAVLGTLLASAAYQGFSLLINRLFASSLQGFESVCLLLPQHFLLALAAATGLSFLAAFGPALRSTRIQPSEVIRDV